MYGLSNINQNTLTELACRISKEGKNRQTVIICDMHKVLFFQKFHRVKPASPGKQIVNTVCCQLTEITADRHLIQIFQISTFYSIFQSVQVFLQIITDHFPCDCHQCILQSCCIFFFQSIDLCQMGEDLFSLVFLHLPQIRASAPGYHVGIRNIKHITESGMLSCFIKQGDSPCTTVHPSEHLFIP